MDNILAGADSLPEGLEIQKQMIQLHVFADTSETAYGTVMYARSKDRTGRIIVPLLCAKSRVAPIKMQTIPRFELSSAVLAADLAYKVKNDLNYSKVKTIFWTDAKIVVAWINAQFSSFTTFVANRIASMQRKSLPEQWRLRIRLTFYLEELFQDHS